jgi:hypothetical protein
MAGLTKRSQGKVSRIYEEYKEPTELKNAENRYTKQILMEKTLI